jgi:hypothetical protein
LVDANGSTDTQQCTIVVVGAATQPISLECGSCGQNGEATEGVFYSETVSVSGGAGGFIFSLASGSSPLPPGLSLNSTTGVISGTPTTPGDYSFTTKVVDSKGNTDTTVCTIKVIEPPLNVGPGTCGDSKGHTGQSYSGTPYATGGSGSYSYSLDSGSLPDGFTYNNKTGTVSGTPTHSGTWVFTHRVTDSHGNTSTTNCTLTVCD